MGACPPSNMESKSRWERLLVKEIKEQIVKVLKDGVDRTNEDKFDESIPYFDQVVSLTDILIQGYIQRGRSHWEMHRWEPARKYFELANRLDPVNDDAGWTLGLLALQMGDFKAGWEGYERRWGSQTFKSPRLSTIHPQWERGLGLKRDRKSTRLNSSHSAKSRMPSSA